MENSLNRLECKLKEIILDSRHAHTSDYSKSIREDLLHGSTLGKNAYTLDDLTTGTTIFMPWKLHKPIEDVFNRLSEFSLMSHTSFKTFVDDFGLFPKFQNTRKKEDIVEYILNKSNSNNGPLNFEQFLLALFILSKYRASVLHTNEQFAFNVLLNSIIANSHNLYKDEVETNFNLNLENNNHSHNIDNSVGTKIGNGNHPLTQTSSNSLNSLQSQNVVSRTSSKNLDGVIYHDSGLIIDTNIGKVYESPRKLDTKDFSDTLESIRKEETDEFIRKLTAEAKLPPGNFGLKVEPGKKVESSPLNNSGSFDTDLVRKLLDVLRDQNLLNDSKLLQDSLEREINLRNELEVNYMERLGKLESEKSELSNEFASQKLEYGKLQVEFDSLNRQFEEYKNNSQEQISSFNSQREELQQKLDEANKQLDRQAYLKSRLQANQQLLILETDFEVKLFSIFCLYKDEECVNGEFVLSEEQLISFCVDFGLTESEPPTSPEDVPKAKHAYNKVCEYGYDGKLNYALFKEFLMNLALLLKPKLTQQEAFRYIVFQLVLYSTGNPYGDDSDNYHPVYVTENNNPWIPESNNLYENHHKLNQSHQNTDPNRFVDVEGKVWFDKDDKNASSLNTNSVSTPRFD